MNETLTKQPEGTLATAERLRSGITYSPRFDIWENDDELVLFGDLPGVDPEDLEVQFEDQILTIRGKVKPRHEEVQFLYGEYGLGDFYRTFSVNEAIDPDKIGAELHNGVLTIHLPKSEAVKPRKIQVKAS